MVLVYGGAARRCRCLNNFPTFSCQHAPHFIFSPLLQFGEYRDFSGTGGSACKTAFALSRPVKCSDTAESCCMSCQHLCTVCTLAPAAKKISSLVLLHRLNDTQNVHAGVSSIVPLALLCHFSKWLCLLHLLVFVQLLAFACYLCLCARLVYSFSLVILVLLVLLVLLVQQWQDYSSTAQSTKVRTGQRCPTSTATLDCKKSRVPHRKIKLVQCVVKSASVQKRFFHWRFCSSSVKKRFCSKALLFKGASVHYRFFH